LFESKEYIALEKDELQGVLAKVILGSDDTNYPSFLSFDKRILIIRDPRDWVISNCIFLIQQIPEIYLNSDILNRIRKYLYQKEDNPGLYPFCDFLEIILGFTDLKTLRAFKQWIKILHRDFINFSNTDNSPFKIFYEDFVDRKVEGLSKYLDIKISDDLTLDQSHAHVPRTRGYGNWRDWFTQKDIDLFQPIFDKYLQHFGYPSDYSIRAEPTIHPYDCSDYVERVIDLRLRGNKQSD
jgi:hypothetical protein